MEEEFGSSSSGGVLLRLAAWHMCYDEEQSWTAVQRAWSTAARVWQRYVRRPPPTFEQRTMGRDPQARGWEGSNGGSAATSPMT